MEKFSRTYKIKFYIGQFIDYQIYPNPLEESFSVEFPISVDMSINRSISNVMNVAQLTIYGLDGTKRRMLAKDRNDFTKYIRMEIFGGYQGNQWLIFRGAIQECYSYRDGGNTEYRTYIESADAAIDLFVGATSEAFTDGIDAITQINNMNSQLIDLHIGAISPEISFTVPARGVNMTGNPLNMLRKLSTIKREDGQEEQTISMDLGEVFLLRPSMDVVKKLGEITIDDSYGLLGTPRRRDMILSVPVLFEPSANLNQVCNLHCKTLGIFGRYKIMGVSHNGTISGAKCGVLKTTIDLFLGFQNFYEV